MPEFRWRVAALLSTPDDQSLLARPLPGVSCFANAEKSLRPLLASRVADAVKQIPPSDLYRYRIAAMPDVGAIELTLPPAEAVNLAIDSSDPRSVYDDSMRWTVPSMPLPSVATRSTVRWPALS